MTARTSTTLHVAVIYVADSLSPEGQLACFAGEDKVEVLAQALRARAKWERSDRKYLVLAGTLTEEVHEQSRYTIRKLKPGKYRNPLLQGEVDDA